MTQEDFELKNKEDVKDDDIKTNSILQDYCKNAINKKRDLPVIHEIIKNSEIYNFYLQVKKMKVWPSFDHIFKAARRDNKWFLRSIPLKGINRILFEEQNLTNISKATYKGLVITPIPDGVIETAVQTIINSNDVLPDLSDYVSSLFLFEI